METKPVSEAGSLDALADVSAAVESGAVGKVLIDVVG